MKQSGLFAQRRYSKKSPQGRCSNITCYTLSYYIQANPETDLYWQVTYY